MSKKDDFIKQTDKFAEDFQNAEPELSPIIHGLSPELIDMINTKLIMERMKQISFDFERQFNYCSMLRSMMQKTVDHKHDKGLLFVMHIFEIGLNKLKEEYNEQNSKQP